MYTNPGICRHLFPSLIDTSVLWEEISILLSDWNRLALNEINLLNRIAWAGPVAGEWKTVFIAGVKFAITHVEK